MIDPVMIAVAAAAAGVVLVVFVLGRRAADARRARLARHVADDDAAAPAGLADDGDPADRAFEDLIYRTGLDLTASQALAVITLAGVSGAALLFFWRGEPWMAVAGFVAGLALAYGAFLGLQQRRQRLIQAQLPDAFFFLARSLRAGQTLDLALAQAGQQLAEPLAAEFRRAAGQIHLGLPPARAVALQARRLRLLDFDVFASTVGLYYTSGGNLTLLLDRLAAGARDRNQFRGYFRAATALARTTALFLAAAAPLLLIGYAVWQPDHVGEFFSTATGWRTLAAVAVLEVVGLAWVFSLLRVDY